MLTSITYYCKPIRLGGWSFNLGNIDILKKRFILVLVGLAILAVIVLSGWKAFFPGTDLPPGILSGNGRLEAQQVNITARYPGRVIELRVREGDLVQPGQILAILDTRELAAGLRAAQAKIERAREEREVNEANIGQYRSDLTLAQNELWRIRVIHAKGFATTQQLDQRVAARNRAAAGLAAVSGRRSVIDSDIAAAKAEADRVGEQIAEATVVSPVTGRVLYRLAQPGELVGAGAPIATILDLSDVYMTIFLSAREAGALPIGAPARIILDGRPDSPFPGRVSFVSPEAQFTPRQVETQTERDNLMYRVRVRLPDTLVRQDIDRIKTGITGMAYVRLDPRVVWPARLDSAAARQFDVK